MSMAKARPTKSQQIILAALRQQLEGDRLLGIEAVPFVQPVLRQPSRDGVSTEHKRKRLSVLNETQVKDCTRCGLSSTRTQTVFGQGDANARLVFVGEAPGFEEDKQGLAFVGRAGQLLTKMIQAMGLTREEVFICNVLKCRPPENRDPTADEILACADYLREQITVINPEVLVALGAPAAKTLLGTVQSIGKLRGRFHDYYVSGVAGEGLSIPLMPTYHPAYLLRSPGEKAKTWSDLQAVMELMELPLPGDGSSGPR